MSPSHKSLLDRILSALGINPVQWRWRWRQRWQAMTGFFRKADNRTRTLRYEHKNCPDCGAVNDKDEERCHRCGAALSGRRASQAGKFIRLLIPEGAYVYTTFIGLAIVALFGAMVMQGGMGMLLPSSSEDNSRLTLVAFQLGADHAWYFDTERLCAFLTALGKPQLCPDYPHVHRLITNAFVHFGILHIAFNAYAFLQLGPILEEVYGRSRFLVIYVLCAIGGSGASVYWHWDRPGPSAGASGAICGLIGTLLVFGYRSGSAFGKNLASELLKWGIFILLFGLLVPNVDNAAHIGGAAVGALLALVIPDQRSQSPVPAKVWVALEVLCFLAIVASFVALFVLPDPVYEIYLTKFRQ